MALNQRRRKNEREAQRRLVKNLRKARREAADLRTEHGMCPHGDEERFYRSEAERDADQTPTAVCPDCGRPKLIAAILVNNLPDKHGALGFRDVLRAEE